MTYSQQFYRHRPCVQDTYAEKGEFKNEIIQNNWNSHSSPFMCFISQILLSVFETFHLYLEKVNQTLFNWNDSVCHFFTVYNFFLSWLRLCDRFNARRDKKRDKICIKWHLISFSFSAELISSFAHVATKKRRTQIY